MFQPQKYEIIRCKASVSPTFLSQQGGILQYAVNSLTANKLAVHTAQAVIIRIAKGRLLASKGGLLHGKRPSITSQKATFWKTTENKASGTCPTMAETKAVKRTVAGM